MVALVLSGIRALGAQTVSVSGNPGLLRISTAVAGTDPIAVSTSTTTYTIVTGNPNRTYAITMQLDANMPAGVTLDATLAAVPGSTSLGAVSLDVTPRNVVTGIPRRANSTASISYSLTATAAAGVIANQSRTVTLTIIQFP